MVKKKLFYIVLFILISFYFQGIIFAAWRTGLPHDPNWLVDEELVRFSPGWNKGHIEVRAARGGVNKTVENQKIINSWGYKARPIEEIEDLLPEAIYNMYCHPEQWGTIRINETPWEAVKPRGAMWEKFLLQSEKNKKNVYLDDRGWMRNYRWGIPFPDLDEKDPRIGLKLIWNYYKRYQDNDRVLRMDVAVKDRGGGERHNMMLNQRLQMSGRTRGDKNTEDGLYLPNPQNIEFVYAAPYVAPYNMRGTIALYYRYNDPDKDDDMWVYIPSIRRVRRLSTNQHQDRCPGGFDWTWDNTEGFEGHVTRFDFVYMGRKDFLISACAHPHVYVDPTSWLNTNDQYYQRRSCYVVKCVYKKPINMTEIILYLDPALFAACYSVDKDMRGRDWIVQNCTQAKDNHWFYALHNIYAIDVLRKHVSRAQMASSQSEDCTVEGLSIKSLKKEYLSR